jgi:hypothetical protein
MLSVSLLADMSVLSDMCMCTPGGSLGSLSLTKTVTEKRNPDARKATDAGIEVLGVHVSNPRCACSALWCQDLVVRPCRQLQPVHTTLPIIVMPTTEAHSNSPWHARFTLENQDLTACAACRFGYTLVVSVTFLASKYAAGFPSAQTAPGPC